MAIKINLNLTRVGGFSSRGWGVLSLAAMCLAAMLTGALTTFAPDVIVAGEILVLILTGLLFFPEIALAALTVGFFLYPLTMNTVGLATSSTYTALFYAVLGTASVIGTVRKYPGKARSMLRIPETKVLLVFAGWIFLNWLLFSTTNNFAFKKISFIPFLMLIPFLTPQLMERVSLARFLKACISLSVVGVGFTVIAALQGTLSSSIRLSVSQDVSPLGFAYSLGAGALLAVIHGFQSEKRKHKILSLGFLVIVVVLMVASGSRGPLIAIVAALFLLGMTQRFSNRFFLFWGIGLAVLAIFAVLPYVSPAAYGRMTAFIPQGNLSETYFAESRGYLWAYSLKAWRSSPFFGIGVGNYLIFSENAAYWEAAGFAHNFVLEILSELGLIGFTLFGVLFVYILKGAGQLLRTSRSDGIVVSAVALFVFSVVKISFSGQIQTSVEFWLSTGVIASLVWMRRIGA